MAAIHHNMSHSGIADLAPSNDSQQPSGSSTVWSSQAPSSLVVPVVLARGPSTQSNKAVTNQQLDIRGPYRSVLYNTIYVVATIDNLYDVYLVILCI